MKITFEDILSKKQWLHKELLNSLTGEVMTKTEEDQFFDVKLLVNNIELEPQVLNKIINNIEKYIEEKAKDLINDELNEAKEKSEKLSELINGVCNEIKEEFNINDGDF